MVKKSSVLEHYFNRNCNIDDGWPLKLLICPSPMVLKMPFFEASLYNTIDEVICMLQHNNLEMILNFLVGLPTYVPL
jgi:hypothetical protein